MKFKITLAIAALAALAVSGGTATAGNGDKVTGGGQVLFGSEDVRRSTLAFTAQGTNEVAKGQVQFIDRTAGGGQNQVRFHGIVDCVETGVLENGSGFGVVSGYPRGGSVDDRFLLRVIDNGQGSAADDDMIAFDKMTEDDTCKDGDDDPEIEGALVKGNAKVRDGDPNNGPTFEEENGLSALSFLGL